MAVLKEFQVQNTATPPGLLSEGKYLSMTFIFLSLSQNSVIRTAFSRISLLKYLKEHLVQKECFLNVYPFSVANIHTIGLLRL